MAVFLMTSHFLSLLLPISNLVFGAPIHHQADIEDQYLNSLGALRIGALLVFKPAMHS